MSFAAESKVADLCSEYGLKFFNQDTVAPLLQRIYDSIGGRTLDAGQLIIEAYPKYTGIVNQTIAQLGYDSQFDANGKLEDI